MVGEKCNLHVNSMSKQPKCKKLKLIPGDSQQKSLPQSLLPSMDLLVIDEAPSFVEPSIDVSQQKSEDGNTLITNNL
ncbi:hypothetical protein Zmor_002024 [Zophobas morio]|uniref:Uncharacterized protein n=1 Tax=Zophobas morio TaxID=2755281 RepID=A0AA38IZT9_9CUCU|nr:hypothetical protein Zmor_002024 [Zophobas morio]